MALAPMRIRVFIGDGAYYTAAVRIGFCVSGGGLLFKAAVLHREQIGFDPAILIARQSAGADLEEFCARHSVPMTRLTKMPKEEFDRRISELWTETNPDLFSLTFDRILPEALVRDFHRRVINMHPSLLPAFRGIDGVRDAIARGVRVSGSTIQEVVYELDEGPIIAQAVVPMIPGEPREAWGKRMYRLTEPMYLQVLAWYAEGRIEHDEAGRVTIRGANYDSLPISPALERFTASPI
jgi:folate-dependent phosphoribosylglycinamide formyltransferase PurN